MKKKIKPSELEAEAQRLVREGKMPTLEELSAVIAEVREKYRPLSQLQIVKTSRVGRLP